MSDVVQVTVIGDKELEVKLLAIGANVGAATQKAARAGAAVVRQAAKDRAPVRTGQLKKSIQTVSVKGTGGVADADVGPTVFYGRFVELGHAGPHGKGHVPAHPFLRPALDEHEKEVQDAAAAVWRAAIEEAGG